MRVAHLMALAVALTCPAAAAGECDPADLPGTLYGLAQDGRMTVNGTTTKEYASAFDFDIDVEDDWWIIIDSGGGIWGELPIEISIEHPEDLWSSLAVDGSDRYALQRDGRMKKNDKTAYDLPRASNTRWVDMVAADGNQYSIRSDGALAVNQSVVVDRATEGFAFRRVIVDRGTIYALRADGDVYRDQETTPLFSFRSGVGPSDARDGESIKTAWTAVAVDAAGVFLYALRTDGFVRRGRLLAGTVAGEAVAELPYVPGPLLNYGERYQDLAFLPDGTWLALQADGRVYTDADHNVPLVDLPGAANDIDRLHVDLEVFGESWFALRSDGRVYRDGDTTEILDLADESYGSMAISAAPPTLSGDGSTKTPKAAELKIKSVVGTPLRVPVTVNDVDTCPDELQITPTELPTGATWDAESGSLVWDAPGPKGSYKFKFDVTDGIGTRSVKWKIDLKDPDVDPEKNKKPLITKYASAQAIAGIEYALLILADDKDGDVLTYTVDETKFPFNAGATFDPVTRVFRWTPANEDQGATTVKFKVSDGTKTKTISVKIKVKLPLF